MSIETEGPPPVPVSLAEIRQLKDDLRNGRLYSEGADELAGGVGALLTIAEAALMLTKAESAGIFEIRLGGLKDEVRKVRP